MPRRGADSTKFTLGQRRRHRRLARADRRAVHGGAGRDARRRRLRHGRRARARSSVASPCGCSRRCSSALPEEDGALVARGAASAALEAVGRADAVVLGPGLGRTPGAQALVRELVERIDVPLVIDADGLNALAGRLDGPAPPPLADGPHAARGRARPAARGRLAARSAARRLRPRARGRRALPRRSSCSRATTRSSPRPTGRVAVSPRRRARAGHGGHRRRALRRHRRDARQGPARRRTPPAPPSTRTCAPAGSPPRRTGRTA